MPCGWCRRLIVVSDCREDRTQTGHILGDPQRRDQPDMQDTKSMSPAPFTLLRMLTHMAMLLGASKQPQVWYINSHILLLLYLVSSIVDCDFVWCFMMLIIWRDYMVL